MAVIRIREHVNPLSHRYRLPTPPPPWESIYRDWHQPLSLDIGCGRGGYLSAIATAQPDWNFLGLEIREPLVERALKDKAERGLTNLHYLFCNVNVSLAQLLPPQKLHQVTIQFPDPWFKRRQHKRRTVQPQLVQDLVPLLVPNAQILLQSDIQPVAREMLKLFEQDDHFVNLAGAGRFTEMYPAHIPTEREEYVLSQGGTVYRAHLEFKPA
ncbi:MAG: tRNA (guanosine(46)-N7)-methyltransferase TrmB [Pseudanabaenaceae cyanobacterium bins.68]|nr:tRNA (guanosine(46)-N7)-methyltransferase TrmB [Pseudanabaenaceae cyanobacterium bins.68]